MALTAAANFAREIVLLPGVTAGASSALTKASKPAALPRFAQIASFQVQKLHKLTMWVS